jgi:hypothetical protein
MDLTVLNLALPRISADLRPSSAQLLWIVDIYGFFVAGMLVTMGVGRRRVLLIGAADVRRGGVRRGVLAELVQVPGNHRFASGSSNRLCTSA